MAAKGICCVDGCDKPVKSLGYCVAHYTRVRRYGSPSATRSIKGQPRNFLIKHAKHKGADCLIWPFARCPKGYAKIFDKRDNNVAHRVMCRIAHGDPPPGLPVVAHSCGRGHEGCVNPSHLRWATYKENVADMVLHGTSAHGRNAKVSQEDVLLVSALKASGISASEIGRRIGVHQTTVSSILRGKTWSWLTGITPNE